MKKVLVPIANGVEEIESVSIIDILRRAGAEVTVASVHEDLKIIASRGVCLVADKHITECASENYDLIVLPGGMPGAESLRDCKTLTQLLSKQKNEARLYGAICAAPAVVLQAHQLLDNLRATCHPNFIDYLENQESVEQRVVVDGQCVTSRSPGTAMEFSLKLVEILYGRKKVQEVAEAMLFKTD